MKRSYDKRIVNHKWGNNPTNDEHTSSNGFVISSGCYLRTAAFFSELAAEAKRDFPHLEDGDIECFIITRSSYNKDMVGVRFSLGTNDHIIQPPLGCGYVVWDRIDFGYV